MASKRAHLEDVEGLQPLCRACLQVFGPEALLKKSCFYPNGHSSKVNTKNIIPIPVNLFFSSMSNMVFVFCIIVLSTSVAFQCFSVLHVSLKLLISFFFYNSCYVLFL